MSPLPSTTSVRKLKPLQWLAIGAFLLFPALAHATGSVYLEELTSTELADAIRQGTTTIIIPVGGTEQNGPHMVLGKHNIRVKALAGQIAQKMGSALVAPVVAYVPEGSITPPTEHMRFAGTISIPETAFKAVLEATGRGFKQHGFTDIVLIGDSGNYQNALKAVAKTLNRDWSQSNVRAHFVPEYYQATQTTYVVALKAKGLTSAQIGSHAGTADTSLLMAIDPALVRLAQLPLSAQQGTATGTRGDPRPSSAALGQLGLQAVVDASLIAIRAAIAQPR